MLPVMEATHGIFGRAEGTFVPGDRPELFLWVTPADEDPSTTEIGAGHFLPGKDEPRVLAIPRAWAERARKDGLILRQVTGRRVPLEAALDPLVSLPLAEAASHRVSRSVAVWSSVAKLAVELVAGHNGVPWIEEHDGTFRARWRASLGPQNRSRAEALARALPMTARAWPGRAPPRARPRVMAAWPAVQQFLDATVDVLVRPHMKARSATAWTARLAEALGPGNGEVPVRIAVEDRLPELLRQWAAPGLGDTTESPIRLGLRLELPPEEPEAFWPLKLVTEAADDPSLQAEVLDLWEGVTPSASALLELAENPHEALLLEIDRACRLWPALEPCLDQTTPSGIELGPEQVVELLSEAAPLLTSAGISLRVPPEISVTGRQRLRARLRGRSQPGAAAGETSARFGLAQVLSVCWEAALGDESISIEELRKLAEAKRPLVRFRDQWLVVDPAELAGILALLERPPEVLEGAAALRAVITEEVQGPGGRIGELAIEAGDALLEVLEELRADAVRSLDKVPGLRGTLRPYQTVGTAWLEQLGRLGLGACLADDMGLGKTVQVIAYLLHRRAAATPDAPSLLICPTSVLGNWERELHRFAPEIPVLLHHGPDREVRAEELASAAGPGGVVVTSYGVLRSDTSLLTSLTWDVAALDEAQFIKNHRAKVARAAFQLRARHRIALTGTPVENRLTDLWSIFAFTNPGLLGGVTRFKKEIARPVERFRDPHALARLQRLTSPFILRRTKSDPDIAPELPPRIVLRSECSLTREQASLYQATLDAAMDEIESSDGIDRRGKVLALITALKQICNHPAQFLREHDASSARSGKLRRLGEELETALAEGDAALLFTQYRVMGEILVRFVEERFALTAPFLHGGVSRSQRETMVARFQREDGPPVMVVSVKAGGTGINLTRASHVVHVDRWWNPAVEAQATDRAHRIGQTRTVVVHTFVTAGTLEERIDKMLEEKAELARLAVAGGEQWLTELDDAGLRELLALDPKTAGGSSDEDEQEVAP